jgi:hypothetical protein
MISMCPGLGIQVVQTIPLATTAKRPSDIEGETAIDPLLNTSDREPSAILTFSLHKQRLYDEFKFRLVNWEMVCHPIKSSGLGVRNFL